MTRRISMTVVALFALLLGPAPAAFAHEGHDHKIMGTVTMAMADHVMLRDRDGKDVTVMVTKATRVKSTPAMKVDEIKAGTRVVITAAMEKNVMNAKLIEVGAAPAPVARK
jgi:hypothetical protein